MKEIVLSFLCGAAFIGGAATVFCGLTIMWQFRDKESRDQAKKEMAELIAAKTKQNTILERIAAYYDKK